MMYGHDLPCVYFAGCLMVHTYIGYSTLCVFCLVSTQNDLTVKPASLLLSKGCLLVIDVSDVNHDGPDGC